MECSVTEYTFYNIKCITGEKVLGETEDYYVGQHGLRHEHFDIDEESYEYSLDSIDDHIGAGEMSLLTTAELAPSTTKTLTYDRITGYFKAPLDGQYQFHQSCDDECKFYMSLTDPMDPTCKELLMHRKGWLVSDYNFRSYGKDLHSNDPDDEDNRIGSVFSEWIPLVKDTYYFIEAQHRENTGTDHATFGVEIQPDNPDDIPDDHP